MLWREFCQARLVDARRRELVDLLADLRGGVLAAPFAGAFVDSALAAGAVDARA
jgi:hypothetical protein